MKTTYMEVRGLNLPDTVRSNILITSVRISHGPGHDRVSIWNRGGLAGEITVNSGDGIQIGHRLLGAGASVQEVEA